MGATATEFNRLLGPSSVHYAGRDDRVAELQVAVDAFALRHQVAESLLRLLHAVLHGRDGESYWVALIDTPTRTIDVIKENRNALDAAGEDCAALIQSLLLSPELEPGRDAKASAGTNPAPKILDPEGGAEDDIERAIDLHVAWINYAIRAFLQKAPDLDAAHNKFKHGMGLRPQDDILTTLTLTPPNPDGSVPLSALTGEQAVNLFDGITTEFLARASRKHGLETTQIAMMPAPTLVEAAAMAHAGPDLSDRGPHAFRRSRTPSRSIHPGPPGPAPRRTATRHAETDQAVCCAVPTHHSAA